ncbi:hypothetical protein [Luteimicrobium subarcticum]|uniref:Helicase-like protein n=1 Tax=Luteimicrobium subarcticum TaxID=620910 RepID=A0A2M8W3M6_9MICO|nr:hypothetical protein [Luteimicrobium subarcticum]PJI85536.1 hypothetical protein CLV34_2717 [Luteimicrobium subarcticum]
MSARQATRAPSTCRRSARFDAEKGRLFAAARSGQVAVLIGSTAKMGVGTNIQDRAVALHHLDCPWRPADLQQRDGRILRQGNQNPEVQIYRWVVERSFDAYSWQTVERKAKFIAQIMRGRLDVREIEDIGDTALSFGEVKALSSGDPLVMEREQAAADVLRLERLERAWHQNRGALTHTITTGRVTVAAADRDIPRLEQAVAATRSTAGDAFEMSVAGQPPARSRADAGAQVARWVRVRATTILSARRDGDVPLGTLAEAGGHTIEAAARGAALGRSAALVLSIAGAPRTTWTIPLDDLEGTGVGAVRQIENHLTKLPADLAALIDERDRTTRAITGATTELDQPFKHAGALTDARARLADVEAQMTITDNTPEPAPPAAAAPEPAGPGTLSDRIDQLTERARDLRHHTATPASGHEHHAPPVAAPTVTGPQMS